MSWATAATDQARSGPRQLMSILARAPANPPPGRTITSRENCFLFGLGNMRPGRTPHRPPDPRMAASLRDATPQDCLDAAFTLWAGRPSDVVAAARSTAPVRPPFRDLDYFGAIARWLGCPFDHGPMVRALVRGAPASLTEVDGGAVLRIVRDGRTAIAITPAAEWLPALASLVARSPAIASRLHIVPPQAIASAAIVEGPNVVRGRLDPLHEVPPSKVADRVITRSQAIAFALFLAALVGAGFVAPALSLTVTMLAMATILVGYAMSRGAALAMPSPPTLPSRPLKVAELPDYSVLVPLYKEDEGLAHLVRALRRIDYPQDKLDIQFLVEADDAMTMAAVTREAHSLPCRMIVVPPGVPRTKPRALNVGLKQARGSIVTIFDAEDRPDPGQLRLAAETFAVAPGELAALQARLTIDHLGDNWLTKMFAIEYASLFDHVMPMLAGRGRIVLLGGTSNHFRTAALIDVGGWDPFNVTEDADLSVRLRRSGYRIAMIDSETSEEAPLTVDAWLKQRSRWFKGYIQTWLVHNRKPLQLIREIGWADALMFHLLIIGALTAGLAHLLFIVQLGLIATGIAPVLFGGPKWLVALQSGAVVTGYGMSLLLGAVSVQRRKRERMSPWIVVLMPAYWVLMGFAVVIAVHDIIRKPHHWRKTTHGVAARPARLGRISRDRPATVPDRQADGGIAGPVLRRRMPGLFSR